MSNMYCSAREAMSQIGSGSHLFIQTAAAAPQQLIDALVERRNELENMSIYQMHTEGNAEYSLFPEVFHTNCFFIGANLRKAVQEQRADYIPVFLSQIPSLFRKRIITIDFALIQVSPPDEHGYCSLGVSVDIAPAILETAGNIIAQVNSNMPKTFGDAIIHISKIGTLVNVSEEIPEIEIEIADDTTCKIARNVASLIEDGATLQMGIGKIPNAVLSMLSSHRKLGIHTEMFSDGIIDLVESGVITGEMKKNMKGKIVSSFLLGTKRLYSFVNNNPLIEMLDIGYVNDVNVIRQNPKVTAINSALEIDITGQVCADSIGMKMYSGVGGQIDFMRGASLSEGGKPIIAMNSTTSHGESKIVPFLKKGAGVVTTRAEIHYVITEYGIADLFGKNLKDRAKALITIAHPLHREMLKKNAFQIKNEQLV
ncbi:MAG: acetyl-CoA hydrolase/transferase C-terminal domain-containing protein [Flavitalea sp.]